MVLLCVYVSFLLLFWCEILDMMEYGMINDWCY